MSQPKIPLYYRMTLDLLGLQASCYQPTNLFPKDGRKLPNCPVPSDPWEVFLRKTGEFGVVGTGTGATLTDALEAAIHSRTGRGLTAAMRALGEQMDLLTETISASQD